jgi:MFS family permease
MGRGRASDCNLLFACDFLRSLAIGAVGVLLGIYLARLGLPEGEIGLVVASGLAGGAAATALVTLWSRRLAPKPCLVLLALLSGAGGVAVAFGSATAPLAAFAFLGMLNGMGRDRGASLALEQAILAGAVAGKDRTRALAWYHLFQDAGHALGGLLAAAPEALRRWAAMEEGPAEHLHANERRASDIASLQGAMERARTRQVP